MANQRTGEIVKLGKTEPPRNTRPEPGVLGSAPLKAPGDVTIIDKRTPSPQQEIEIHHHDEIVTVRSHTRSKPLRKDEPDVRVRAMTPEGKKAWEKAKRAED